MLQPLLFGVLSGMIALTCMPLDYHPPDNGGPVASQPIGTRLYHRASGR